MTLNSVKEYTLEIRKRYLKANKKEKGPILEEFIKVTGYHRKSAIRVLLKVSPANTLCRGRSVEYTAVLEPLKTLWEASDRLCSKETAAVSPGDD